MMAASDTFSQHTSFSATTIDFPVVGAAPSPEATEAQWLASVRARARELYLQAKHKGIPRAKLRTERQALDAADDGTVEAPVFSDEETAASVASVTGLLDRLTTTISDASSSSTALSPWGESAVDDGDDDDDAGACPEKPPQTPPPQETLDWRKPDQLDKFLGRCVQGWEMQNALVAQHARMHRIVKRLKSRIRVLDDQKALLAWYAAHLKGGLATSSGPSAPSAATVLKEAETAVLQAATETLAEAVEIQTAAA